METKTGDMRLIRYVKVFEKKQRDNYEQIDYLLTVDDFYAVKKYSRHVKNGKYLCQLIESMRHVNGNTQAERTVDMLETNKIVQKRSYINVIIVLIIVIGGICWFLLK